MLILTLIMATDLTVAIAAGLTAVEGADAAAT